MCIRDRYIESIKEIGYLREYAYENIMEFVAVCLEHYYETPENFKEKLPILYSKIEELINTCLLYTSRCV